MTQATERRGVLDFDLAHRPDFALLTVRLEQGQQVFAEPSAMAAMDPTIKMKAGFKGGLKASMGRMFSGESLIINTFTADSGPGEVSFAAGQMGDMVHYPLDGSTELMLQRGAFVAHSPGVELSAKWGGAKGFFSGQGLVLLKASGQGDLFFNSFGAILDVDVIDGFIVDTGYIVAFESTLDYSIGTVPGMSTGGMIKSFLFGGERLVCDFRGRGKVWIQTRDIAPFVNFLYPYRPTKNDS
jgi:uncharacterized protein (TIGR00266 family)